ncbi:uncharacterized protein LOC118438313 [Folsomia candida]|uniref:FHA domain-containing protein n=1 Tax=Folsomia candida TaxID=158441 RepID=A0A226DJE5_FOLCA|nr:uncharacterized protein LOC118438313 [Folsomia candida]OXA44306.1 hypothetical protein Fcan01_20833 [Folsomia candida]
MEGKSSHLKIRDGVLFMLRGVRPGWTCSSYRLDFDWEREAVLLNKPGQKYTIGKNLESFDPGKYGQFLKFCDNADVSEEHCQIECDASGNFWLRSLGQAKTFLNGKLIQDSPVKLKFGDILYFSYIFSPFWDSLLFHLAKSRGRKKLLYRKNSSGEEFAVFKFDILTLGDPVNRKLPNRTKYKASNQDKSDPGLPDFKNKSPIYPLHHPIFENHIILTKIFEHLANPDPWMPWHQRNLFNFRLVSKSWNDSARLVLQKNFVPKFRIVIDKLILNPYYTTNRFDTHRMKGLKFDAMNIDIWPEASTCHMRDNPNRDKAVIKFNQDFSAFINHPDFHPLKVLTMNVDYLTPISTLLTKFCPSLEELDIQINMMWINDEKILDKSGFPEDLRFPKLKKLTLEFCDHARGDLNKMSDSKCLAQLLQATCKIEELVLKNYGKLPGNFDSFENLRKITIYGGRKYNVEILNLHDFLVQFMTLPTDQLSSFKLDIGWIPVQSMPEEALLNFLEKQRQSLENLEISVNAGFFYQCIKVPRCMPKLKKLWISVTPERKWVWAWGFKLSSQLAKGSGDFTIASDSEILEAPLVAREGSKCGQKSCPSCNDSLVYGTRKKNNGK